MCIASCSSRRTTIDNPRRIVDGGVWLGEGTFPSPRALSTLSTSSNMQAELLAYFTVILIYII